LFVRQMTNEATDFSNSGWKEGAKSRRRHCRTHPMR